MTTHELVRTLSAPDFLRPNLAIAMVLFVVSMACLASLKMQSRIKRRYLVLGFFVVFPICLVFCAHADGDEKRAWQREEAQAMAEQWGIVAADPGQLPGLDASARREVDVVVDGRPKRCELASFQQDARDGTWRATRITAKGHSSRAVRLRVSCPE